MPGARPGGAAHVRCPGIRAGGAAAPAGGAPPPPPPPPGAPKPRLARAVANESDANFFHIAVPEIMGSAYGESEKRLRDMFEQAAQGSPSIIFIDEIDSI